MAAARFRWPWCAAGWPSRARGRRRRRPAAVRRRPDLPAGRATPRMPTVHTVSVCPLGPAGAGARPRMPHHRLRRPEHVAMVRDRDRRLSVDDVARPIRAYDPQACDRPRRPRGRTSRRPCSTACRSTARAPGLVGARGVPPDQFSLHASGGRFRALLKGRPRNCRGERDDEARLTYPRHPAGRLRRHGPRGAGASATRRCRASNRIISPTASPTAISSMAASAATGAAFPKSRCRPLMWCRSTGRRRARRSTSATP